jgi:hypothetical protein
MLILPPRLSETRGNSAVARSTIDKLVRQRSIPYGALLLYTLCDATRMAIGTWAKAAMLCSIDV